jgi:streptogramin lyase
MMKWIFIFIATGISLLVSGQNGYQYSWKYYTSGNTGILGDYAEAIWIDDDNDPYLAAYTPGWEEGGFSKYIQAENRWINYSNIEYPVIGSIYDVGSSRIHDIAEDNNGLLWMATWRGILKFDPNVGGSSLQFWGAANSLHPGGRTMDIDVAPDGSIWATVQSVTWGGGGLVRFDPATNAWQYWGYGSNANNWPSLIGFCERVSIQEKPAGGYVVWVDGEGWNTMITFDSDSQLFTLLPQNNVAGEIVALPGNDCIDDEGNLWALRNTSPGNPFSLDYLTPGGMWVTPAQPGSLISDIWAFTAFGNHEALITGLSSEVWQFTGTAWQSKGIWREGAYTSALAIDNLGNIWVSGVEGAAKRDVTTGLWQRHRVTNSSQIDYWVQDIATDQEGNIWMTGNGGPNVGGFQKFDGTNWTGFNQHNYGLGFPFPFPSDNTQRIFRRPSNGDVIVNPTYNGLHAWNGTGYTALTGSASISKGITEDSEGRLWNLGDYYLLQYFTNNTWTSVPFIGSGANIRNDLSRPSTVWACSNYQVLKTDGSLNYSKSVEDFSELDPQSDALSTVVPAPDGIAWVGTNQGLIRLNSISNTYQFFSPQNSAIPGESITPLAYTPDGRVWFTNFGSVNASQIGLCWYNGSEFGIFPVEDEGLPHAQIPDVEVKLKETGYELWMSCLSRGIAVLDVVNTPVGISQNNQPETSTYFQSYPNPAKDITTLDFSIAEATVVNLTIYSITGEVVAVLVNQKLDKGKWSFSWNLSDQQNRKVNSGIYVAKLMTNNYSKAIKIIVK